MQARVQCYPHRVSANRLKNLNNNSQFFSNATTQSILPALKKFQDKRKFETHLQVFQQQMRTQRKFFWELQKQGNQYYLFDNMIFPQAFQSLKKKQWDNGYLQTCTKEGKSQTLKVFSKNFQQFFIEVSTCQRLRHNSNSIQLANYFESDIEKAILYDNYSQDIKDFLSENNVNDLDKFIIFGLIVKAFKSIQEELSTTNQIFQHRDIKPENMILGEGNKIKIAGFGMSRLIKYEDESDSYHSNQQFGTPGYMDPVMEYLGEGFQNNSDLWSLGATLFFILTMKTLSFEEIKGKSKLFLTSDKKTKIKMLQEIVDTNINNHIKNNECKRLLKNLLTVEQHKRYDWHDLYQDGFILQLLEITRMQNL